MLLASDPAVSKTIGLVVTFIGIGIIVNILIIYLLVQVLGEHRQNQKALRERESAGS